MRRKFKGSYIYFAGGDQYSLLNQDLFLSFDNFSFIFWIENLLSFFSIGKTYISYKIFLSITSKDFRVDESQLSHVCSCNLLKIAIASIVGSELKGLNNSNNLSMSYNLFSMPFLLHTITRRGMSSLAVINFVLKIVLTLHLLRIDQSK